MVPIAEQPQALGSTSQGDVRECMFCGTALQDRGAAFLDHVRDSAPCGQAYQAWLDNLGEDRPGG